MQTKGNTILITGATSGIGRALAEQFHARGNTVIIAGRRQELLDEITAAHPGMHAIAADMADPASVQALAAKVKADFPKLNVVLNNAGIARQEDYKADTVDTSIATDTVRTNILGVIELSAALLPTLRVQPASTLMVTTSGLAFVPYPHGPVYGATKAFMHSWLEALRVQLRGTTVEVLELPPPYVQTELGGEQQKTDPRAMPLADFTAEVMQILDEGKLDGNEILVGRVKPMRYAERDGTYAQTLEFLAKM